MNEADESQKYLHPLILVGFGWVLFVLGLLCWAFLWDAFRVLAPFAEWPKVAAISGVPVPLLFAAAWKYDRARAGEIISLVVGWSIGAGMAWLAFLVGSAAPHG